MPVTILYDRLISERIINPLELSRSNVYRYVADMVLPYGGEGSGESLRFSYQYPGEMWQGDVMYGP
ncbi:hypothetical protein [Lutispora sp.]|uniref:hypothetical protein n=1 Tax=Lutispora sp. TaxID=2828727 RepID=UPI002B2050F6|nr:hypothetical protein [Lutispora sp.]MEA4962389.1 hypothetical protein [Lutispora sp.]